MLMNYHLDPNYLNDSQVRTEKIRDGLGTGVAELGADHDDVVVLGADTMGSARAKFFAEKFPARTVQVGVAEQNLIGVTAGFAYYGKVPYAFTYAPFLIGRPWEPIRTTLCYPNNHAVLVSSHAGLATGEDGPTHQMTEDIALTACLPNMTVIAPCDYEQARKAARASYGMKGPVYLRGAREGTPVVTTEDTPFEIGTAQVFREGSDVTAIAHGYMVHRLLAVAEELKHEVNIEVINVHTIKPFDVDTLVQSVKKTGRLFVAEDHSVYGGLGTAAVQALAGACAAVPARIHGIYDTFAESGSVEDLWKEYKLDVPGTREILQEFLKEKC